MFNYSVAGSVPTGDITGAVEVWSRSPIQPLAGDVLTPLSASVLTELLRRAWFAYYDRLGFNPAPLTQVVRMHAGRAYLNLSVSARQDAEQAGLEPITLHVDGQPFPLASVEKPGILGGFKMRGKRKQADQLASALEAELADITTKAEHWCARALEMRWSQAEVLQVMEEIERVGLESMTAYLAARHNLERLYNRLLLALPATETYGVLLINNTLSDLRDLVEVEMAAAVVEMSRRFAASPSAAAWFGSCDLRHWQEDAPGEDVQNELDAFLSRYGHRALHEGELAHARWYEDRDAILRAVHACIKYETSLPSKIPSTQAVRRLLDVIQADPSQVERDLQTIRRWHIVQSRALHALAYVWTGTRRWALAAANEAGADGRVAAPEDIFYYELEEVKQMMTGEWNISDLDQIHAVCAERKADHARWQAQTPGEILIGDQEGARRESGLGAVSGHAVGALRHWREARKNGCRDIIVAAPTLDSGWAVVLPIIHGAVSAGGAPVDPFISAARIWHRPTVVALGPRYAQLVEGAQISIDSETATVEQ